MNTSAPNGLKAALSRFYNAKGVKPLLLVLGVLFAALVIYLNVERVRGRRAWEDYQSGLKASGQWVDYAAIKEAPVPDGQNFAAAPISKSFAASGNDSAGAYARAFQTQFDAAFPTDLVPNGQGEFGDWPAARHLDLLLWRARWNSKDLLVPLQKFDTVFADFAAAANRPETRFPLEGDPAGGDLGALLANLTRVTCLVEFRALAELDEGQPGPAAADVATLLRAARRCAAAQPINYQMLAIDIETGALMVLWEGLSRRQWDDGQLAALEQELAALDPLATSRRSWQFEAAFSTAAFAQSLGGAELLPADNQVLAGLNNIAARFPRGWFYQTMTGFRRYYDGGIIACYDLEHHRLDPAAVDGVRHREEDIAGSWSPYQLLLKSLPPTDPTLMVIAQAQSALDEARVAVALERARRAAGQYPEKLAELAPQFLAVVPPDVVTGQPLQYRRAADGDKFVLYSVGWNGKDDGGWTAMQRQARWSEGDWVWSYEPQKQP